MPERILRVLTWPRANLRLATAFLLIGLVAVWYSLPALSIAYTEGFQPSVVINAYALRLGDPHIADTLYPFNGRFFLLTRLGTSLAVLALQYLGNLTGLEAFRLLGIGSLVLLLGAILTLLWRVYRVGPALGLLCCILFPPTFESAYLPNDDLPSAALICLGVLLFWPCPSIARTVLTGLLLGTAALLRLDAVLVTPAFAILLLTEVQGWRARALRAGIAGIIGAAVPIIAYRLCGLSFLDTFPAVNQALTLWDRPNRPLYYDSHTIVASVTVAGGLAWVLGVTSFARARRWRDLALAVVVPLLYVAAYRSQLVEGRYLLPLSPFILLAVAEGFRSSIGLPRRWRLVALAGFAVGFAIWIMPPLAALKASLIADPDGPRLILGRAWNPLPVLWWQGRLRAGQAALETQIERIAATPDPVIVTGYWNGDCLTTLLLLEHGFALQPDRTPEPCRGIAETLVRGPIVLTQIRTHIPFLFHASEPITWEKAGMPCLRAAAPTARRVLFVGSGMLDSPTVRLDGPGVIFSSAHDQSPPLIPRLVSVLGGMSVAELPIENVSAVLGERLTPEDRQAAVDALARRADLLR